MPPHLSDPINPDHYRSGGMEAIDVIEAFFPDSFHLGNAFKYIARAGKKGDRLEDLRKARWYVDREIARLEPIERRRRVRQKLVEMVDAERGDDA